MPETSTGGRAVADVAVVGGGPVGLAVAWRTARRGLTVSVYDPQPGSGAVYAAAGMLAPVAEASFGERDLTGLLVESAGRWPAFAAELEAETGIDIGFRTEGTLVVALTADDLAEVRRLVSYQDGLGLPISARRGPELRAVEPLLAAGVRGGAYAPDDHQVDPRRLVTALRAACVAAGVRLVASRVPVLSALPPAAVVVVAAGCGSAALTGLPVRPVKGQVLRLRAPGGAAPGFRHVIRGCADGRHVYLVPRLDGEVVVGATAEERADDAVTAGGVLELLRAATDLVPELTEYELVEACVRHRPGTPDNGPILGRLPGGPGVAGGPGVPGGPGVAGGPDVLVATGHYRHGIVLTPLTADVIAAMAMGAPAPVELAPFAPARFAAGPRPPRRPAPPRPLRPHRADQGPFGALRSTDSADSSLIGEDVLDRREAN